MIGKSEREVGEPHTTLRLIGVDGNHLCGLGHTAQTVRFYRDLAVTAQPEQSFDIRYLTDRVNT